jgi:hypothetical protein
MSQIADILRKKAEEFKATSPEAIAVGMLKQAGFDEIEAKYLVAQESMEKEAARTLVDKGVDVHEAAKLVKAAGINIREMTKFDVKSFAQEDGDDSELLVKAAEYIEALEAETVALSGRAEKLALEKSAAEQRVSGLMTEDRFVEKQAAEKHISRLNQSGAFTFEDLEQLKQISPTVLQKVASITDSIPSMGSGSGIPTPKNDPLLDFLMA